MPTLTSERITRIASEVLQAAGASAENGDIVGQHLADANLAGHDSHGFIRIPQYVRNIREGQLDPKAQPRVNRDNKATAQISGNDTFGQVAASFGTRLAMKKAKEYGVGMVSMYNLGHTGRIGTYPEMVAREGMAGIMFNGGLARGSVAPFGGREGRLSTNPISLSFPASDGRVMLLDFATSMAAEGKLRVYSARGHELPDDWVLTKDGAPSRNPNDYYDGGAILPMGGLTGGHKGYALSFMTVLFGRVLSGLGAGDMTPTDKLVMGTSITVIDLGADSSMGEIHREVDGVIDFVKSTPPMEGFSEVLYPGEIEANSRRDRLANGVPIEETTWGLVVELIDEFSLRDKLGPLES
jgi:LDH2 family malate/lactate/ureidoglycolate dehydrogenase